MIQENEVITLVISAGIGVFLLLNRHMFSGIPHMKWLWVSYIFFISSLLLTVAEGFFWVDFLNFLEHLFTVLLSAALAAWCRAAFALPGGFKHVPESNRHT